MLRSLRSRLTLAFLLVAVASVALVGYLFHRLADMAFYVYLVESTPRLTELFFPRPYRDVRALIGLAERRYLASLRTSLWQAGLGVAVASGLIGFYLAHRLSKPLNELTRAASEMANRRPGQLTDIAPPPRPGDGEVERLSRAFHAMAQSLDRHELQRRQFLADITHELRTPLTVIQGRLEAMLDGVIEPTAEEIASLHSQALLLGRLVQDLEMLALAQAKELTLRLTEVDPLTIAADALQAHAFLAERDQVALKLDAPEELPHIVADPQRLTQVLHNLIVNALRHSRPNGSVILRVEKLRPEAGKNADVAHGLDALLQENPEGIAFSVLDTGEGIPKAALPTIFDPFTRVDPSRNRKSGGSGLGLAIVRYLAEAHNGAVWLASKEGVGTRVTLWLPLPKEKQ